MKLPVARRGERRPGPLSADGKLEALTIIKTRGADIHHSLPGERELIIIKVCNEDETES